MCDIPLDGWCVRVKWLLSWPVSVLLYCTIPDCSLPRWERWYLLTFLSSTLWIAFFSYLMVWMVGTTTVAPSPFHTFTHMHIANFLCVFVQVTIISYTLGIPEVIMGITFLAAGTSVPDCMASLIVARQGASVDDKHTTHSYIHISHIRKMKSEYSAPLFPHENNQWLQQKQTITLFLSISTMKMNF